MGVTKVILAAGMVACIVLVGCVGAYSSTRVAPTQVDTSVPERSFMGGGALGGNAETTFLFRLSLDDIPGGPLAWVTHRLEMEAGEEMIHRHQTAFVYAVKGIHDLIAGSTSRIEEGQAASVRSEVEHTHRASWGPAVFWETRLDRPGSAPAGFDAETIFESPVLEGIPDNPMVIFVLVTVPPGGETSIHTHPGPEFIYQLSGSIDLQDGITGVRRMIAGDAEGILPGTAVQKRNPYDEPARFLSWFLVDSTQDFASPGVFKDPG